MPFTAPVLNIGQGLADGILSGANSLDQAAKFLGQQYIDAKAAEGTAQFLTKSGAMTKDELNEFMGKSVGAKQQIIGMKMAQFMHGVDLNNQKSLQNNQSANVITQQGTEGQVQVGVNKANIQTQMDMYKKYGFIPGRSPDENPAPQVTQPTQPTIPAQSAQPTAPASPLAPNSTMIKNVPGVGPVQILMGSDGKPRGYIDPKTNKFTPLGGN